MTAILPKTRLTADAVAAALVVACRATGENPESFVEHDAAFRARHYALHALVNVFRRVTPFDISSALCCPGKAKYFYRSSLWWVLGFNPKNTKKRAEWWDDEVLGRVIEAVEAVAPSEDDYPDDEIAGEPAAPPTPAPAGPVIERGPMRRAAPHIAPGKGTLHDMLAEAVRNTAQMEKGEG